MRQFKEGTERKGGLKAPPESEARPQRPGPMPVVDPSAAQKLADLRTRAEQAESARDAAIKEMAEAARKLGYVEAENDALRYAMREAVGDLECADSQSVASDDQIIMEHVRLASKTLRIAMAKKGQPR